MREGTRGHLPIIRPQDRQERGTLQPAQQLEFPVEAGLRGRERLCLGARRTHKAEEKVEQVQSKLFQQAITNKRTESERRGETAEKTVAGAHEVSQKKVLGKLHKGQSHRQATIKEEARQRGEDEEIGGPGCPSIRSLAKDYQSA